MRKSAIIELEDKWQGNVIIYLKGLTRKKSLKKNENSVIDILSGNLDVKNCQCFIWFFWVRSPIYLALAFYNGFYNFISNLPLLCRPFNPLYGLVNHFHFYLREESSLHLPLLLWGLIFWGKNCDLFEWWAWPQSSAKFRLLSFIYIFKKKEKYG